MDVDKWRTSALWVMQGPRVDEVSRCIPRDTSSHLRSGRHCVGVGHPDDWTMPVREKGTVVVNDHGTSPCRSLQLGPQASVQPWASYYGDSPADKAVHQTGSEHLVASVLPPDAQAPSGSEVPQQRQAPLPFRHGHKGTRFMRRVGRSRWAWDLLLPDSEGSPGR